MARERDTLATLVDEVLLAQVPLPTPQPVGAGEVAAGLATFAADLTGPPDRDRAAVRYFLERERRRERDARLLATEHARTRPEVDEPLLESGTDPDDVLARLGEHTIRRRDVERRAALALYRLRGELARERLRQLDALLEETLWRDAAAARGVTVDELRAEVRGGAAPVTDEDVEQHFEREVRARDPDAVPRPERIRPYLEFRRGRTAEEAFLARQRAERGVVVELAEPAPPLLELAPGPGGYHGADAARVRVVLLTSYRGAASRRAWTIARELAGADVAVGVRPLLPQWDPEGTLAAAAARCAAAQGRFWAMQDAVASAPSLPDRRKLDDLARALELDERAFAACLDDPATHAAVAADSAAAERLGLVEPPVFLVNGRVLGRNVAAERVRDAVAEARAAASGQSLSAPSRTASASR